MVKTCVRFYLHTFRFLPLWTPSWICQRGAFCLCSFIFVFFLWRGRWNPEKLENTFVAGCSPQVLLNLIKTWLLRSQSLPRWTCFKVSGWTRNLEVTKKFFAILRKKNSNCLLCVVLVFGDYHKFSTPHPTPLFWAHGRIALPGLTVVGMQEGRECICSGWWVIRESDVCYFQTEHFITSIITLQCSLVPSAMTTGQVWDDRYSTKRRDIQRVPAILGWTYSEWERNLYCYN